MPADMFHGDLFQVAQWLPVAEFVPGVEEELARLVAGGLNMGGTPAPAPRCIAAAGWRRRWAISPLP
jgi:hypothetical protein